MTADFTTTQIETRLAAHIAERVSCRMLGQDDAGRSGCVTPLQYPDGDNVVVWIRPLIESQFEVTDYGEALAGAVAGKGAERRALDEFALMSAKGQGVLYEGGRLVVRCGWDELAECVWRLAVAATQLTQAAVVLRPRRQKEVEFVSAVERDLRAHDLSVERERRLEGQSGHQHKATIYLPSLDTVIEPVTGHWNQVYAVYAKLGDLRQANGYRLYTLVDDRESEPSQDVAGMLVQVSDVIQWSHRAEWITSVTSGP